MQVRRFSVIVFLCVLFASVPARGFLQDHSNLSAPQAPEGETPLLIGAGLVALAVVRRRVRT